MNQRENKLTFAFLTLLIGWGVGCGPEPVSYDWPMWRYDANRSAASPQELADTLHLLWVREYPKLTPTWDDPLNQDLMQFDKVYEPVVHGKTLFIGSNASDCLIAVDTETGAEKWRFYVGGPVRFPAVAANQRVYFVSDDGYLYCVNAETGEQNWKFQGMPSDGKILGNERLISTWPARGGPVLKDGIVYFGAGIWPFMGVFIYALDAETGEVVWENDSTGSKYMLQPHNSPAYAGVAPQGNLVVAGDKLLVPCGRSVPACFDLKTGALQYYHLAKHNKTGGAFVSAVGSYFVNYHRDSVVTLYDLATGDSVIRRFGKVPVMTKNMLFSQGKPVTAFDLRNIRQLTKEESIVVDKKAGSVKTVQGKKWSLDTLWTCDVDASGDLIQAGKRLYAGGKNVLSAVDIPRNGGNPHVKWKTKIEGTVARIIAADRKLFAVTLEGRIYAFGGQRTQTPTFYPHKKDAATAGKFGDVAAAASSQAAAILKATGVRDGYCLAYGLEDGALVEALVRGSQLRIIAVDPDAAKVAQLRKRFDAVGLYGKRLSVQVGDVFNFDAPPYLASLTIFENLDAAGYGPERGRAFFERIYRNIRPYGGIVCLPTSRDEISTLERQIQTIGLAKATVHRIEGAAGLAPSEGYLLLSRDGSLPGAADWTHQYADIANTVKSDDKLVKLPLGVLWFGGSSNMDVLPRHGHGPPEQIVGGRLFIEGIDNLTARDVYTGRDLWKRNLSRLDTYSIYYDKTYKDTPLKTAYNQVHIPGANVRGTNYVATEDKVYLALTHSCLVLDPATGKTIDEFRLPAEAAGGDPPEWGYLGVYKDYLIAGADFVHYLDFLELDELDPKTRRKSHPFHNYDIAASKRLVLMNRHTGEVLWTRRAKLGFWHNAIAAGNDVIYCIDMLAPSVANALKRRMGKFRFDPPQLTALNVSNGREIWHTAKDVFGTWLSYSKEYDIVLQAGRKSRDMIRGEPKGLIAYNATDGTVRWKTDVSDGGPYMLHGDTIITDRAAYSLLTGVQKMRVDPLTGEEAPWAFKRNYGCNYAVASEHLLTFRSAAAGFYDLSRDGGTGNFGGFRSGCTSNLIAANGVLNAPDYTRTCSCSYQNQTSLALIHMPELEMWTTYHDQRNESFIAKSRLAVAFTDLDGKVTYVNGSFLKLFGYKADEDAVGKPLTDLWRTPDNRDEIIAVLRDKGSWSGKLLPLEGDDSTGVERSVEVNILANPITDETDVPIAMMMSFTKRAEGATAFLGLDGRLTYVDNAFLKLWQFNNEEEALDKSFVDLWQAKAQASAAMQAWRNLESWYGELMAVREDGSTRDVFVKTHVVRDDAGQALSAIGTFVDVTARKLLVSEATSVVPQLRDGRNIKGSLARSKPIRTLGINFGAPGDRRADNGTLWLEYPSVGGPSPAVSMRILPEDYTPFVHHASRIGGEGLKWVVSSGLKGVSTMTITLDESQSAQPRRYLVRLYFAEPDELKPGQRRFHIAIQGKQVLQGFDIIREAGSPNRSIVKEFSGILAESDLTVTLTPDDNAQTDGTLICGIEIIAQEG